MSLSELSKFTHVRLNAMSTTQHVLSRSYGHHSILAGFLPLICLPQNLRGHRHSNNLPTRAFVLKPLALGYGVLSLLPIG